ncbi:MAG: DMT family transporter [Clostridia bacterium]|nr:DMT family transporter [Clostridia bacterium]
MKKNNPQNAMIFAFLAALLYGISTPVSKILLNHISPTLMAASLYLGAGFGMFLVNLIQLKSKDHIKEAKLSRNDLPYVMGMIILDIVAPVLMMFGLTMTTSGSVALLNNFEIVATSILALFLFKETIGKSMWISIGFITIASLILSLNDLSQFSFSMGSILVILATISWGLENNCTRMLSLKNPIQIVMIKGFGSGLGALIITILSHQFTYNLSYLLAALFLGFVAYGLSIYFYIRAQRDLGASRTSTFYAAAPFIGVLASWLVIGEDITITFIVALFVMLIGTYFAVSEEHNHLHIHEKVSHNHLHSHDDGHHDHHEDHFSGEHSHEHLHEYLEHHHKHTQDMHHRHAHD